MKLYLAGPMRNKPEYNFPAFLEAAKRLRAYGHTVLNPAEHDLEGGFDPQKELGNFDLGAALLWDLNAIHESEGIVLLPDWKASQGVHLEIAYAQQCNKMIYTYEAGFDRLLRLADVTTLREVSEGIPRTEVPTSESGGQKGVKLQRFDLLPSDVLWELATHYGRGCKKYDDRNWEKGYPWSWSLAALERHLNLWKQGEDTDDDPVVGPFPHLIAVIWHACSLLAFQKRGLGSDDRRKCTS